MIYPTTTIQRLSILMPFLLCIFLYRCCASRAQTRNSCQSLPSTRSGTASSTTGRTCAANCVPPIRQDSPPQSCFDRPSATSKWTLMKKTSSTSPSTLKIAARERSATTISSVIFFRARRRRHIKGHNWGAIQR